MQFKEFDWLSSHYTMPNKYGKCTRDFGAYFSLLFYILGAFLIKQLFYSRLLDVR